MAREKHLCGSGAMQAILLVAVANYRCCLPKVGSYVRQVALCG